jgi:glutamyl-tRNA synthetase
MSTPSIRARFAPSPTGFMHLGNVRTAVMNYLFTHQKNGTLILRIEDTDQERNFDVGGRQILADLAWLGLTFDEGPTQGGPHEPYFQSKRMALYTEWLDKLIAKKAVYRCFCTAEELEKKRQRQIDLKMPPRYDRTCLNLVAELVDNNLANKVPFIWRFKLDPTQSVTIHDLARGDVHFELKNFSDFPLARQDGSPTFIFANCVDDIAMGVTHIFRGEDHLSNTANQAALFTAFEAPLPTYWHMPILFNTEGKKLSKRDFGFSLVDLKAAGYLPEAICNYLALIGGGSFEKEDLKRGLSLKELTHIVTFDHMHATGQVRYDVEKLRFINHLWITQYDPAALTAACMPFLTAAYQEAAQHDQALITQLIQTLKTDITILSDIVDAARFFFQAPALTIDELHTYLPAAECSAIQAIVATHHALLMTNTEQFLTSVKADAKLQGIPLQKLFMFLRLAFTGHAQGPSIHDLVTVLGAK